MIRGAISHLFFVVCSNLLQKKLRGGIFARPDDELSLEKDSKQHGGWISDRQKSTGIVQSSRFESVSQLAAHRLEVQQEQRQPCYL